VVAALRDRDGGGIPAIASAVDRNTRDMSIDVEITCRLSESPIAVYVDEE